MTARLAPTVVLLLAALTLTAATAEGQTVTRGTVDGHYYKWIIEGQNFIVCTNTSLERGKRVQGYLDWAYPSMVHQFDANNRGRYEKQWEVNFGGAKSTTTGLDVLLRDRDRRRGVSP